ncbi:MAG: ribosome biogenesis GTPase Der [Sporocytophaga sp.]|uniref:ribosome biogenesis GTPase Der n=1 Tax=Sporocytophaga sp. TaxID=2231183 RepID=UPI001B1C37FC|nr:ribosome biogenesis GTPase Der [Sporocytophaga sp.]MBO9701940.1 ribosome biogenesis GTPase Der [Sporocytophaga sp.]
MANIIAIVGRPNVGKSTLFNRLVGTRTAIMDDMSGVTRDRHYGYGEWTGKFFTVVDTGGYVANTDDLFEEAIKEQVDVALEEATVVLFVVDTFAGLHPLDEEFAHKLRRAKKPVFLVANKADTHERANLSGEFYALGVGDVYPISSQNGSGTGELLDEVVKHFSNDGIENPDEGIPKIAIIGRPNVGKSSFLNVLLGRQRSIVTDIAGTTRDAVDAKYTAFNKEFIITDTAGLRKKARVKEDIEFYSVLRSIRALEASDVCIVIIDAQNGLETQDLNIIGLANRNRKGIVLLVNKWDLVEKDTNTAKKFEDQIRSELAGMDFIPIIFVSVLNKQRIHKAIETAIDVYESRSKKVTTSALNEALLPEIDRYPPPSLKGKHIKIKYITQLPTHSPTFAFFCNLPQYIKGPYAKFLENKLREHFGFEGVPINIVFRKK